MKNYWTMKCQACSHQRDAETVGAGITRRLKVGARCPREQRTYHAPKYQMYVIDGVAANRGRMMERGLSAGHKG